jgi:hypothetical protein
MNDILAFHIVWTAYGTWLSGDASKCICKKARSALACAACSMRGHVILARSLFCFRYP